MNFLTDPLFLGLSSLTIGIIALIIAFIFYFKSKIRIMPNLAYKSITEVSKLSDCKRKIKVLYNDKEVSQVTTTKIWFWNNGKRPLKREDIPLKDPLRITIENKKLDEIIILDYNIIKISKESLNFNLLSGIKLNELILDFDYLDYKDGGGFEIQHTGNRESQIKLEGVILGPKKETNIIKNINENYESFSKRLKLSFFRIAPMLIMLLIISPIMVFIPTREKTYNISEVDLNNYIYESNKEITIDSTNIALLSNNIIMKIHKKKKELDTKIIVFFMFLIVIIMIFFDIFRRRLKYPKTLLTISKNKVEKNFKKIL
jgi:hypothetical protein